MSEAEEGLAADLRLTRQRGLGPAARRRHGPPARPPCAAATATRAETLPITVVRGLAHDPDPAAAPGRLRRRAGGLGDRCRCPLAAALNGAKGETNVLNRRRGWADALEPALFTNGVDRGHPRRHARGGGRLAARLPPLPAGQGPRCSATTAALPWWDLFAPVGDRRRPTGWPGPTPLSRVRDAFGELLAGAGRAGRAGHPTSGGSTPSPAPARRAAPSACRSAATSRG